METKNSKKSFTINAGVPVGSSEQSRKRKPPSQIKRNKKRMDEFLAKKLETQATVENKDNTAAKVILVEPKDEISLEACEKLFVIAKSKIDNHNIGIQYDVTEKLEAKELKVKKLTVERKGDQIFGEFIRCEVFIEPTDVEQIEKTDFGIKNCWVLPCT